MKFVLLTDDDDGAVLVACEDQKAAEAVGNAAVWGSGGVSAWLLPEAVVADDLIALRVLKADGNTNDILHASGRLAPITIEVDA